MHLLAKMIACVFVAASFLEIPESLEMSLESAVIVGTPESTEDLVER